ncbi:DUF397 domain-containing protein [Goodfellowiella coeruleoviolacea]|uniref:DUF397 domain-containing protein n=1 Tax=Goodfellowiella coeruleoviolacea TaxID=334858 RepID=A0AAE3GHA1_9PSEU|nr:DUF397 domain-containing protein [Goodfellowiella coeruleoviolacea]MCP2168206.1 protein of unknown function (DUF397) [Goodfellowiella coeruleoviolacea]
MGGSLPDGGWVRSSRSGSGGDNCVEVRLGRELVGVRDSKNRHGGALLVGSARWRVFVSGVRAGRFDLAE